MFDLILKGGTLPDGRTADIGITGGAIAAIEDLSSAEAGEVIDATGDLVSPPFVDPHFHMDATLSYGIPRINASGTLLEGIGLWGELKQVMQPEVIKARALEYCDWAASLGLLCIRSHVDTCHDSLIGVEALLEVRKEVADYIDLQLVAFPQDGLYRDPTALQNTIRALDMGVDVVGGIPHFERTMADGARSVTALCEIAAERGLMVDMHCDETDDPHSRHIETLAYETQRLGLQGRVAGSHLTSMHSMDNYYVSKLLPLMAEAEVAAIPNPLINIVLQGRHDTYPKRRGLTRVKEMQAMGIDVGWGQDCVMDPWYSMGTGDMLDVAFMGLHVAQMTSPEEMRRCFDMVTNVNARIMGLDDYGLRVGAKASMVVLDAGNPIEALRLRPDRLCVIAKGKVISRQSRNDARLDLPGRPVSVRRRHSAHS
ncbi:amidohydrolase family protein [Sulfitobacter mediterraneus]|uniref:amidohydrolase family protein n=1 Tax=Sulfitobacter mediterraneus TaxID=83219 RepID=UPI001931DE37|nr:amidohydrolase family protein [Sulfitobacter mediterraneus]MBM1634698.1 amidohydrolase family protein [Sulfitobacter mediterraneus]MBM1642516.1 amidohydrolase family protein [Sulfitobacter mediterraneus]MBM1646564.1 amidohydrolase family protein [Sulfitobacter mediterraneus]MBM1650610.1 amidohydrolase family protein [Sulfitobacter mediterraneus]MBM1654632.1 amidohydrolase family protein [Sulfitobacter mediterraneus]